MRVLPSSCQSVEKTSLWQHRHTVCKLNLSILHFVAVQTSVTAVSCMLSNSLYQFVFADTNCCNSMKSSSMWQSVKKQKEPVYWSTVSISANLMPHSVKSLHSSTSYFMHPFAKRDYSSLPFSCSLLTVSRSICSISAELLKSSARSCYPFWKSSVDAKPS